MSLAKCIEAVQEFHRRLDTHRPQPLRTRRDWRIVDSGQRIAAVANNLRGLLARDDGDARFMRAHLAAEECAELIVALGMGDEEAALDAVCDIIFVAVSAAVQYDWPLEDALAEVCRSNLTKEKQANDPLKERVRQKGPNYSPPDIAGILQRHRERTPA